MSMFRGLGALTRAGLLQTVRSRTAIFWNVVFPLIWLFLFGFVFGRGEPATVGVLMPGLFTITIISSSWSSRQQPPHCRSRSAQQQPQQRLHGVHTYRVRIPCVGVLALHTQLGFWVPVERRWQIGLSHGGV